MLFVTELGSEALEEYQSLASQFLIDKLHCSGVESSLLNCSYADVTTPEDCKAVGVQCSSGKLLTSHTGSCGVHE